MTVSYKISDSLHLVQHPVSKKAPPAQPAEVPTDHILALDCSGSMSYDLPKLREQLKKKLPKLLKETDTLSIVWFSGRGEFGVLLEAEPVATLGDLKQAETAIDRWIRPVGMTGFKEPLVEVSALADRLAKKNPKSVRSLFFMSDGCDNQWGRGEILKAIEGAAGKIQSATFVEYGYYADRPLLTQMAEKAGGSLIFAEDFDRYQPAFEAAIKRKVSGAPRVEVDVKGDPIGGFVFALSGGDLVTFAAASGKASVAQDLGDVFYLSTSVIGTAETIDVTKGEKHPAVAATYAALSLFATRMQSDVVFALLRFTGDVQFIEQFATCFGKQKYSEYMDVTKQAAFEPKIRLVKGYDPKRVPRDDAFTVLDVLNLLQQDDQARVLLDHSAFKYSRIGRGRVDATENLTDDEQAEIAKLSEEMKNTKDSKKVKELSEKIAAISNKPDAIKFVKTVQSDGYPIMKLTFNEDRPNVSFLVRHPGKIDLTKRLADVKEDWKSKVPTDFDAFCFRNYAVIKDGLVNIDTLPVRLSESTFAKLKAEGAIDSGTASEAILNLRKLPVINRKMVKTLSAKEFFETEYELCRAQAAQKVYKDYAKVHVGARKSEGYAALYGDAAATWLKEQGITDYNGFQPPKTAQAPTTDVYKGKELKVSLKGLSSLPKVAEVKAKIMKAAKDGSVEWIKDPKLNAPGALMKVAIKDVETFLTTDVYTKADDPKKAIEEWLDFKTKEAVEKCRSLIFDIAQATFCTVVGQVWFKEFSSIDENTLDITKDGNTISCKVEMQEIDIAI